MREYRHIEEGDVEIVMSSIFWIAVALDIFVNQNKEEGF